ncbi:hypothetical protein [Desulfoferrobacter suflitae]|uniref:hypothetical protein n=1 Tax=Desulfoferrobacter suflitae TaxID=2865782 RepID=UPI002164ECE5|nr:hypothetical protein [Desulfoferrobacter suflitae]MCK8601225.1 hypothetical protein [Desulfoferrobacter suflitae]
MASAQILQVRHLRARTALLLELPVRVHDLLGLHGRKLLGHDLQRDYLDVPGLRRHSELWQ